MSRPVPPDRLEQLRGAALRVFARQGLRRTRMADVAREAGLSPGALYTYFAGKEALFHWLVEHGADPGPVPAPPTLPVPAPAPGATETCLREAIARSFRLPALDAALLRRPPADVRAELTAIVRELYERMAATRVPAAMLERSALELPELFAIFFVETRRALFERLARYLERRARAGRLRPLTAPAVAARQVAETVTWFARHRHGDPDPTGIPDDDTVREQVIALVVAGLVPD